LYFKLDFSINIFFLKFKFYLFFPKSNDSQSIILLRIVQILKRFSHGYSAHEPHENEATQAEKMRWRNPQNKLEIEGAQFGCEKEHHKKYHVKPSLETGSGPPVVLNPIVGTELSNNTFQFATERGYIPEAAPIVRLH
jgi:hypothetical protein